jgi:glycosyltransferase involved in cell wall biosynthesis
VRDSPEGLKKRIEELERQLAEERDRVRVAADRVQVATAELEARRAMAEAAQAEVQAVQRNIQRLTGSTGFRLLEKIRHGIDRVAPWGTRRRGFVLAASRAGYVAITEGRVGISTRVRGFKRWRTRFWERAPEISPSLPLDEKYQLWLDKNRLSEADKEEMRVKSGQFIDRPLVSIIMAVRNADPGLLTSSLGSVRDQIYDRWELCLVDDGSTNAATRAAIMRHVYLEERMKVKFLSVEEGRVAALNEGLAMSSGDLVGFLTQEDELHPAALFEVVRSLDADPEVDLIYTDEDRCDSDGRRLQPFFKPGWSPDLLLSMDYLSHFSVYRAEVVRRTGGLRSEFEGAELYDLALRVTEDTQRIRRIMAPLYSWRSDRAATRAVTDFDPNSSHVYRKALGDALDRRGKAGSVLDGLFPGSYRVRYEISDRPKVSIIIPTRDKLDVLERCVNSVRKRTTYDNYEIVIVDNDSSEERTRRYLADFEGRVLAYPGAFNYSSINNFAADQVDGDMLVLLNNDTEVIADEWLVAMLEHCQRPEVGVVGARLFYPEGGVQHEGILVGCNNLASNVDHQGYCGMGEVIRDVSAVTAACTMMRREIFFEMGGLDEEIPVAFNDVDLCLKAGERGYRVVYTPYAALHHYEGKTRGRVHPLQDEITFQARWGYQKRYKDPYYNDNLDVCRPFVLKV